MSVAYIQKQESFVASRVFPQIPSEKASNLYYTYTKNDWFRDEAAPRTGGAESVGSGYGLSTTQFQTVPYAIHKDVDDFVLQNSDAVLRPLADAAMFVTQRLLIRQEVQFASDFMKTGVWGTDITGVASAPSAAQAYYWSDYTNSTPIQDVKAGRLGIQSITGIKPNKMVVGRNVFEQLRDHPDVREYFKYTSSKVVTADLLAPLFEVDEFLIADAVYATNKENETAAYSFVHGKNALLCYSAPSPSILTPSAGYQFVWTGVSQGMGQNIGIKQFRMEHLIAQRVEGQIAFVNKAVATDLGYFYSGIVV
jgi:hypothetical protein